MQDNLSLLKSSCVQVLCPDVTAGLGKYRTGSGYFVSPTRVVTCEHVVRGARVGQEVKLVLYDGTKLKAHLAGMNGSTDVAVLQLSASVTGIVPLKFRDSVMRTRPFQVLGFPAVMQQNPLLLEGVVHDPVGRDARGVSAIVLQSDMLAAGRGGLAHGYSGAAVLVDGAVVGHLRRVLLQEGRDKQDPDRLRAEMGLLFATPARDILRMLGEEASFSSVPAQPPGAAYNKQWYIPRPDCERRALAYLRDPGSPAVIYGSRQSGKSWLLANVIGQWQEQAPESRVIHVNLMEFDEALSELDLLTEQIARALIDELGGDDSWLQSFRTSPASPMIRLGSLLNNHVLKDGRLTMLALDGADVVLGRKYAHSFFGGLRAWMEKRPAPWKLLRLMLAISTTPARMINEPNQSPFNIVDPVELPPLTDEEILRLTWLHKLELTSEELYRLQSLVGGHPYLARRVLFELTLGPASRKTVVPEPDADVFKPHLRSLLHFVQRNSLDETLARILRNPEAQVTPDQEDLLKKAGLVRRSAAGKVVPTCTLYRHFFTRVL